MRRGMANMIDYGWSFCIVRLVAHAQRELRTMNVFLTVGESYVRMKDAYNDIRTSSLDCVLLEIMGGHEVC